LSRLSSVPSAFLPAAAARVLPSSASTSSWLGCGDAGQGFDGGSGCTDIAAMTVVTASRPRCTSTRWSSASRPARRSAGSALSKNKAHEGSATVTPSRLHQRHRMPWVAAGQVGIQPRGLIGLVFDIGSAHLSSASRYPRGPSAAIPRSETASSSEWRESSQLARLQLARISQLARVHLPPLLLPPPPPPPPPAPPRWVAGGTAPPTGARERVPQAQRWFGPVGSLALIRSTVIRGVLASPKVVSRVRRWSPVRAPLSLRLAAHKPTAQWPPAPPSTALWRPLLWGSSAFAVRVR